MIMHDPYNYEGINSGAHFDGQTYSPVLDHKRLTGQLKRVYDVLSDGNWITLAVLSERADCPESSASARLRDLRKDKFGGHKVERIRHNMYPGLFLYRLEVDSQQELRL